MCMYVCMCVYVCMGAYVWAFVCVCVCVCVRERERWRERERESHLIWTQRMRAVCLQLTDLWSGGETSQRGPGATQGTGPSIWTPPRERGKRERRRGEREGRSISKESWLSPVIK